MQNVPLPAYAHQVNLPWGPDATLGLELPPGFMELERDTIWPDLEGISGRLSGCASKAALDAPEESPPLERLVQAGSTVALVVDDPLAMDAGPRGPADRPAAAARGGDSIQRCDHQCRRRAASSSSISRR